MRLKSIVAVSPPMKPITHQPAFDRQRREIARDVVAADDVENQVDAAAAGQLLDDVDEILGAVVDRALGAELFAGAAFLVRAGGREHPRAARRRQAGSPSCRCRSSRRGRAPISPACSRPRSNTFVQTVKNVSGIAAAVDEIHRRRARQALRGGSGAERRVAAARDQRADAIADAPVGDAVAERVDRRRRLRGREGRSRPAAADTRRAAAGRRDD